MERSTGFEPVTSALARPYSTAELTPQTLQILSVSSRSAFTTTVRISRNRSPIGDRVSQPQLRRFSLSCPRGSHNLFGEDGRYSSFDLRPTTEPPPNLERATGIEPVSVAWRATAPPVIPYSLKVFVLNLSPGFCRGRPLL